MKIHIAYPFEENLGGGGSQFLKSLREYFIENDVYTHNIQNADIILFNSHHLVNRVADFKKRLPEKIFVHRVDGPMRLYNNADDHRDSIVNVANRFLAEGTIFQSGWSQQENYKQGFPKNFFESTILNAPNGRIFNRNGKILFRKDRKIRLIAVSWSDNRKKGFDVYHWLDRNLDFSKYEFVFVGRSPVVFENIIHIPHSESEQVAMELKKSDIFITASEKDPCSNALLEALHCGLPAIVYADGGHPEIVGTAGEAFRQKEHIPELLKKIEEQYDHYQSSINALPLESVGTQYYRFCSKIYDSYQQGTFHLKPFNFLIYMKVQWVFLQYRFKDRLQWLWKNCR